jgi:hypothetical protein
MTVLSRKDQSWEGNGTIMKGFKGIRKGRNRYEDMKEVVFRGCAYCLNNGVIF